MSTRTPFGLRVAQTMAWCVEHGDPARPEESLRSADLRPGSGAAYDDLRDARIVDELSRARSARLEPPVTEPVRSLGDLAGGRFLVFFPDETITDGASAVATNGFFDAEDVPPWDTWLALRSVEPTRAGGGDRYLVSWVPGAFVSLVEAGIDANAVTCVDWLDAVDVPIAAELRASGLLA